MIVLMRYIDLGRQKEVRKIGAKMRWGKVPVSQPWKWQIHLPRGSHLKANWNLYVLAIFVQALIQYCLKKLY